MKFQNQVITILTLTLLATSSIAIPKKKTHPEGLTAGEQKTLAKTVEYLKTKKNLKAIIELAAYGKSKKDKSLLKEFYESKIGKENPKVDFSFDVKTNTVTYHIKNKKHLIEVKSVVKNQYQIDGYDVQFKSNETIDQRMRYLSRVLKHQSGRKTSLLYSLFIQQAQAEDSGVDLISMWAIIESLETPASNLCKEGEEGYVFTEKTVVVNTAVAGNTSAFNLDPVGATVAEWKSYFAEFYCKNPDSQVAVTCDTTSTEQSLIEIRRKGEDGTNTYTLKDLLEKSQLKEQYSSLAESVNKCCSLVNGRRGLNEHLYSCNSEMNSLAPLESDELYTAIKDHTSKSIDAQKGVYQQMKGSGSSGTR